MSRPQDFQPGEAHPGARLTEQDVRDIRAASAAGETYQKIALRYGVAMSTVGKIMGRINWRHVK